ncbi:MAG: type I DNA topoisomerase [Cyanobacteria bacterium HKST-UBA06]|nr:type I DNA topoisomerase [Cyanobacteria bacterium HKST-UBA06]
MTSTSNKTKGHKKAVIVESPAKAETINKYLGKDYMVIASYGHIRDLPAKDGSVQPDEDFSMVWEVDGRSKKRIDDIVKVVKGADELILATDPDREGEAISWHVKEVLQEKKALQDKPVSRVVFNEITKKAILAAMDAPRDIDMNLVNAYLARRALDYLVGFSLSPVLWRKLPGSRSAGRVQSVALRLVCEREDEIERFIPEEYWTVETDMATAKDKPFTARLTFLNGDKLDKMSLKNEAHAKVAVEAIDKGTFTITQIERKQVKRNPAPPFITSTLQQDASRKFGFGATRTMMVAQKLYEGINIGGETVGLITYMRTDGVTLSGEAVAAIRDQIASDFGQEFLPDSPRAYKSKSKNAQEAHEAIRPTDIRRAPELMKPFLSEEQFKLYQLIWKRTMACQMSQAVLDQVAVDMESSTTKATLRANGSVLTFDGFYRVYRESRDDQPDGGSGEGESESDTILPVMAEGESVTVKAINDEQHFTKPPPRYTEASLIKRLEELSIGRPSTYASIIRILQDRKYVKVENRRFTAEDRGRLVTAFLVNFFEKYVQYDFTADLEEQLDDISGNRLNWQKVLKEFWGPFSEKVDGTKDLTITTVLDVLDEQLGDHFFPPTQDGSDPRQCPSCKDGRIGLRLGRFGAFIGCNKYPECKYTRQFKTDEEDTAAAELSGEGKEIGTDPATGKPVLLCKGPYGLYVQLGHEEVIELTEEEKKKEAEREAKRIERAKKQGKDPKPKKPKKPKTIKPKRTGIPKEVDPFSMDLDMALGLLSLPRQLGLHPDSGEMILAGLGRFGPYVQFGPTYVSLKKEDNVLTIDHDRAVELIRASGKKTITAGEYKKKPVTIHKGRFGHYIKYGLMKISLKKDTDPESVTLEEAVALIEAKKEKEAEAKAAGKTKAKAK